jgi:hypothetical protein
MTYHHRDVKKKNLGLMAGLASSPHPACRFENLAAEAVENSTASVAATDRKSPEERLTCESLDGT